MLVLTKSKLHCNEKHETKRTWNNKCPSPVLITTSLKSAYYKCSRGLPFAVSHVPEKGVVSHKNQWAGVLSN